MELPQSLWNQKLSDGRLFSEFVERTEPSVLPLKNITAFKNVWQQRLAVASATNSLELREKSQKVLQFLADHNAPLTLLIWSRGKLGVIFEPNSRDFLLLD